MNETTSGSENSLRTLAQSLASDNAYVSLPSFSVNLILGLILSLILIELYSKYGRSLSNRRTFGAIFPSLLLTTLFIITVVKSSLALSLGLVGALSIVRFRTAIKEPEELIYLFFSIALGLGLGAGQRGLTIIAFILFALTVIIKSKIYTPTGPNNAYLTLHTRGCENSYQTILQILKDTCSVVHLRRYDKVNSAEEFIFYVNILATSQIVALREKLLALEPKVDFTLTDQVQPNID